MFAVRMFTCIVALMLPMLSFAQEPVLITKSKYRKIDKSSTTVKEWGIPGAGVGNIICSTKELPKGEEDKYTDVRDKFYYGEDKSIHCRIYYPGTLSSLEKMALANLKPGSKLEKRWAVLKVSPAKGLGEIGVARMNFGTVTEEVKDWDTQRIDLLPYVGGEDQDFEQVNLSKILDNHDPGEYNVSIDFGMKFNTGTKQVTTYENGKLVTRDEPTYRDYIIATGIFKYIKR